MTVSYELLRLVESIRSEAAIASRAGQTPRLEAIADALEEIAKRDG